MVDPSSFKINGKSRISWYCQFFAFTYDNKLKDFSSLFVMKTLRSQISTDSLRHSSLSFNLMLDNTSSNFNYTIWLFRFTIPDEDIFRVETFKIKKTSVVCDAAGQVGKLYDAWRVEIILVVDLTDQITEQSYSVRIKATVRLFT